MSKKANRSSVASERAKWKHFILIMKKRVELLIKLKKGASMKRISAKFGAGKFTGISGNPKIHLSLGTKLAR
jgi:hypothetical protein